MMSTPEPAPKSQPTPLRVILSDLHLADGQPPGRLNPLEDFTEDDRLIDLLNHYAALASGDLPVELILNGDIFDLLKIRIDGIFPEVIDETVALRKLEMVIIGHPAVFDALQRFADSNHRRIVVIPGNHDIDLMFPMVGERLRRRICRSPEQSNVVIYTESPHLLLPDVGVIVSHGHQGETVNRFNYDEIFLRRGKQAPVLNLPWGSYFVLRVINRFKERRPHIDRVHPMVPFVFLSLFVDFRFSLRLLSTIIYHWTRTRLIPSVARRARFGVTFRMLAEELVLHPKLWVWAGEVLRQHSGFHTLICGHNHRAAHTHIGGGLQYVNTGTWGTMTSLRLGNLGTVTRHPYALIDPRCEPTSVRLLDWHGRSMPFDTFVA
jgi:UDP-2,3-diacylglucosamine pyrophosphatase LpxH